MHSLLVLLSLLLIVLIGTFLLQRLRSLHNWSKRRLLQQGILFLPLLLLSLGIGSFHALFFSFCTKLFPWWFVWLDRSVLLSTGLLVLGALGLGVLRHVSLLHTMAQQSTNADNALQQRVNGLFQRVGGGSLQVLLCSSPSPLAITYGLFRPRILLSSWMLEHLDHQELDAVLAHEIAHIMQYDYPLVFLTTILRDAFCYLPTSRLAYRQFQREKELVCDEHAVAVTHRPLALASALTKVWLQAVDETPFLHPEHAPAFFELRGTITERIQRLLAPLPPREAAHKKGGTSTAFLLLSSLMVFCLTLLFFALLVRCILA